MRRRSVTISRGRGGRTVGALDDAVGGLVVTGVRAVEGGGRAQTVRVAVGQVAAQAVGEARPAFGAAQGAVHGAVELRRAEARHRPCGELPPYPEVRVPYRGRRPAQAEAPGTGGRPGEEDVALAQQGPALQHVEVVPVPRADHAVQHHPADAVRETGGVGRAEVTAVRDTEEARPRFAEGRADRVHVVRRLLGGQVRQQTARVPGAVAGHGAQGGQVHALRPGTRRYRVASRAVEEAAHRTAVDGSALSDAARVEAHDVVRTPHALGESGALGDRVGEPRATRAARVDQEEAAPFGGCARGAYP